MRTRDSAQNSSLGAGTSSYILNDTFAVLFLGKSERVSQRAGDRSPRL
jgi:hypothetical protein